MPRGPQRPWRDHRTNLRVVSWLCEVGGGIRIGECPAGMIDKAPPLLGGDGRYGGLGLIASYGS
jgi:hypothetical protein